MDGARGTEPRYPGVRWLDLIGTGDTHRVDRTVHLHGETRRPGPTLVQHPVTASGALWKDAEQLATTQYSFRGIECRLGLVTASPVDRNHAHRREEELRLPRVHVLGLADKTDVPRERQHHKGRVEKADVVRTENRWARFGKALVAQALDLPQASADRPEYPTGALLEFPGPLLRSHALMLLRQFGPRFTGASKGSIGPAIVQSSTPSRCAAAVTDSPRSTASSISRTAAGVSRSSSSSART